jgi:hypothetical protein
MALINNPNLIADIQQELLNAADRQGAIDTAALTNIINQFLPPNEQLARGVGVTTGIYKRFGEFDKVDARTEVVTTGLWSGDKGQLTEFFTSSVQTTEAIERGENFTARRTENIQTQHFFCRATNREFNFSNNPTYYDPQTGDLSVVGFDEDPKTYITTVGLYNDSNELIAAAKSSRPIPKSFSRETLLKVKLEF